MSILGQLLEARIFDVQRRSDAVFPNHLVFTEACDNHFHMALPVEDVARLAAELLELAGITGDAIDTSDIPEVGEAFFQQAKLRP